MQDVSFWAVFEQTGTGLCVLFPVYLRLRAPELHPGLHQHIIAPVVRNNPVTA
jgi:hypothetical protein